MDLLLPIHVNPACKDEIDEKKISDTNPNITKIMKLLIDIFFLFFSLCVIVSLLLIVMI